MKHFQCHETSMNIVLIIPRINDMGLTQDSTNSFELIDKNLPLYNDKANSCTRSEFVLI